MKRVIPGLAIIGVLIRCGVALAQGGTDIYLAPLEITENGIRIGEPVNVTDRPGYDNQPFFTPESESFYFTSIHKDQADIYRYDLERKRIVRVTATPASEYSPTPVPGSTGFSVVQVEADSTQRLWEFSADGKGSTVILAAIQPVGYHAWGNANKVALFVLGEPHTLQLADVRSGHGMHIAENIGRSLARIPGRANISFMQQTDEETWWIKDLSVATRRVKPIVKALPGSQDYAWTPDGGLLMAAGSTIHHWDGRGDWEPVADFAELGLATITRLAVSPDGNWLAMVVDEASPEEEPGEVETPETDEDSSEDEEP